MQFVKPNQQPRGCYAYNRGYIGFLGDGLGDEVSDTLLEDLLSKFGFGGSGFFGKLLGTLKVDKTDSRWRGMFPF